MRHGSLSCVETVICQAKLRFAQSESRNRHSHEWAKFEAKGVLHGFNLDRMAHMNIGDANARGVSGGQR